MKKIILAVLCCLVILPVFSYAQSEEVKEFKIVARLGITVDYSQSIKDVVELGEFNPFDTLIIEESPIQTSSGTGIEEVEVVILEFKDNVTSIQAETAMRSKGLQPANIWDAGFFAQKFPDPKNKEQFLVFLGSVWRYVWRNRNYYRVVPALYTEDDQHCLFLLPTEGLRDNIDFRFAAVKKSEK